MTRHPDYIILVAFGTSSPSPQGYRHLENRVRKCFPESTVSWSFSSDTIRRRLQERGSDRGGKPLPLLLREYAEQHPEARVVVQSVHLCPGHEFHRLVREVRPAFPAARLGLPLLSSPDDHRHLAATLMPLAARHPDHTVLLLGHGTSHPSWTTLPAFAGSFQQLIGRQVYSAALEHDPNTELVLEELAAAGRARILVIPLLLAAGRHLERDILGEDPDSWKSRLASRTLQMTLVQTSLLDLEGTAALFCSHIRAALEITND